MKHIQGFNEKFNFSKLNIFSEKEKEKLEEKDCDDDTLANAIFKKVAPSAPMGMNDFHIEVSGNFDDRGGMLKFEFDGDKFIIYPSGITINGRQLKCKESICKKFWNQFKSVKKGQDNLKKNKDDKEVKDKLKDKYIKK
jgi:hypothetical protein